MAGVKEAPSVATETIAHKPAVASPHTTVTITHLLLDIEGTTCPVSFVAEVLFPYARRRLGPYLQTYGEEPEVMALVEDAMQLWRVDDTAIAQELLRATHVGSQTAPRGATPPAASAPTPAAKASQVIPYLEWLIDQDVKATPLKDLQGRIWREGYSSGEIVAQLFHDVADALRRWHQEGLVLGVYSSGSVPAQKLLYRHSQAGDLTPLFSHWFDTRTGAKQEPSSYATIAAAMGADLASVLFVSDSLAELHAAERAGMAVLFSDREGNPGRDSGPFARISDYSQLSLDGAHGS